MKIFVGFQVDESERKRLAEYQRIEKIPSTSAAARALLALGLDAAKVPGGEATERSSPSLPYEKRAEVAKILNSMAEARISDLTPIVGSAHAAGRCLREFGYVRAQKRIGGKREWVFRRGVGSPEMEAMVAEAATDKADVWVRNLGLKPATQLKEALESDAAALARKTAGNAENK